MILYLCKGLFRKNNMVFKGLIASIILSILRKIDKAWGDNE